MNCFVIKKNVGGGRFLVKVFKITLVLGLVLFAVIQVKNISFEVPDPPYLNTTLSFELRTEIIDTDPFFGNTPGFFDDTLIEDAQKSLSNMPIAYWKNYKYRPIGLNRSCARFPTIFEIEFNNIYWQTLHTTNGTFQLFNAYLDKRVDNRLGPTVRIVGMINRVDPTVPTFCQFWYDKKKEPVISKSFKYNYIWYKRWGNYKKGIFLPYLIDCVIPHRSAVPVSVSLVENACDNSTNNIRVIYNKPTQKKDFAVCVKGLDYPRNDLSVKLVEWIEVLNLLGADKIFFYEMLVHPNMSKVLKYYEKKGKVKVTPITLAGGQPNIPYFQHWYIQHDINRKRRNELIPYNDCFYKHMYEYKYIVLLDIDEVIMPINDMSWKDLLSRVIPKAWKARKVERSSFNVRNVYFLDSFLDKHARFIKIARYMHMLQHVYRVKNHDKPGYQVKSFYNTEQVLLLHNHNPLACLNGRCSSYAIDTSDAQLHHYRADCTASGKKTCQNLRKSVVVDTTMWKFQEPLEQRVSATLKALGYFSNTNSVENRSNVSQ